MSETCDCAGHQYECHCKHCMIPIDEWKPLDTYKGKCCELYSDMFDEVFELEEIEKREKYTRHELYQRYLKIAKVYPDIPDLKATFNEIVDALIDTGPISRMVDIGIVD